MFDYISLHYAIHGCMCVSARIWTSTLGKELIGGFGLFLSCETLKLRREPCADAPLLVHVAAAAVPVYIRNYDGINIK